MLYTELFTHPLSLSMLRYAALALTLLLLVPPAAAQQGLTTPRVSPPAQVTQTIGLTEMSIAYHRPAVNDRVIWGALVPYDQVWRAGANENTVFQVSTDVQVNGQRLPAGRYGLHMIPTTSDWTIIFSSMADAWGSFSYVQGEDVLRVTATPRTGPFTERLAYHFHEPTTASTEVALHWDTMVVPFTVEADTPNLVLANMETELRGLPRFSWNGWNQIAAYALQNGIRLQEALGWVDQSIGMNRNGQNLATKMGLLTALGRTDEAEALESDFYAIATEAQVNTYGYQLLFGGRQAEAVAVFRRNVADHPESWNVYDSLGEALAAQGETAEAIEFYERARAMAPSQQHSRIDGILTQLRASSGG